MTNHPIQPSTELVERWINEGRLQDYCSPLDYAIAQCAQWSADQQLEACCESIKTLKISPLGIPFGEMASNALRNACRPKPPSLRKQACDALDTYIYGEPDPKDKERTYNTIRRALEALPNDN